MTKFADYFSGIKARKAYDPGTALSLAVACDLAYKAENTVKRTSRAWGFRHCSFVERTKGHDIDTQGYVMADETDIVCVFRGSDDIRDWFANFQAVRDPGPLQGTQAHEGFQDSLYPAVIAFTNAIDSYGGDTKRIWITGHSLGGAICSLYAGMLIENGYEVYAVYNFASPRPGNDDYAVQLNQAMQNRPHYRVVNDGDIVPHLPPEPFFSHPGKRVLLYANKKSTATSAWTQMRKKVFEVLMSLTGKPWERIEKHLLHHPDHGYIKMLIDDLGRVARKSGRRRRSRRSRR